MNMSPAEAASLTQSLLAAQMPFDHVEVGICPTFLCIPKVVELAASSKLWVGGQDCFWAPKGAFTGHISAQMLQECGVAACIVGHSETRGRFGKLEIDPESVSLFAESNFTINLKIKALLELKLIPILCVGETLQERQSGFTDEVIEAQLSECLAGIGGSEFHEGVVAYEPVWAIGTGEVCETEEASRVCGVVRATLGKLLSPEAASHVRVLYGGSVKSGNSGALFAAADIDGGLVGGASLVADEFVRIITSAK